MLKFIVKGGIQIEANMRADTKRFYVVCLTFQML